MQNFEYHGSLFVAGGIQKASLRRTGHLIELTVAINNRQVNSNARRRIFDSSGQMRKGPILLAVEDFSPDLPAYAYFVSNNRKCCYLLHMEKFTESRYTLGDQASTYTGRVIEMISIPPTALFFDAANMVNSITGIGFSSQELAKLLDGVSTNFDISLEDPSGSRDPEHEATSPNEETQTLSINLKYIKDLGNKGKNGRNTAEAWVCAPHLCRSELQENCLSLIHLISLAYGERTALQSSWVCSRGIGRRYLYSKRLIDFQENESDTNLLPLFVLGTDASIYLQRWLALEQACKVGIFSFITTLEYSDNIPLENQLMNCCTTISYLYMFAQGNPGEAYQKTKLPPRSKKNPNKLEHEPGIGQEIFLLFSRMPQLLRTNALTNYDLHDKRSLRGHGSGIPDIGWNEHIANDYNYLKHGDFEDTNPDKEPDDLQTMGKYLFELKLMLRIWIAWRIGFNQETIFAYLQRIRYRSPLSDKTLFSNDFLYGSIKER